MEEQEKQNNPKRIIINPIELWGYLRDTIAMIWASLRGRYPLPKRSMVWTMLFLIYFVLPIDFMPELFFSAFGFGDDLVFLVFVLNKIKADVDAYRLFKKSHKHKQDVKINKKVLK